MKMLHVLKQTDLCLQLLGLLPVLFAIVLLEPFTVVFSYLWIGAVQVVSSVINGFGLKYYQKHMHRRLYQYVLTTVAVLVGGAGLIDNAQIGEAVFYTLMAVSPFIAVWYFWISYKETKFARSLANRSQFVNI